MSNITIVVVAFNRPKSLCRLLQSLNHIYLKQSEKVDLHISIDYREDDNNNVKTIDVANNFNWKFGRKIVDVKSENYGLKKHVLYCGNLVNKYENIIVLEDDIVVSPLILQYSKQVIDYYCDDDDIAGFGLYSFQRNILNNYQFFPLNTGSDVYFMQYACSWGQLWTKKRWISFYKWYEKNKNFDFSVDERIPAYVKHWGDKSWLKYHIYYCIVENKYFVYPHHGLTTNFTEEGTHNKIKTNAYQCDIIINNQDYKFNFSKLNNSLNVYDAFFENNKIKYFLNSDEKIESDVYGNKTSYFTKKVLSSKKMNYKILDSFSLEMYPYEANLYYNVKGDDLFLYDTSINELNNKKDPHYNVFKYFFKLEQISCKNMFNVIVRFTIKIIKRIFKR